MEIARVRRGEPESRAVAALPGRVVRLLCSISLLLASVGIPSRSLAAEGPAAGDGFRVESVEPSYRGAQTGILPGDRLIAWSAAPVAAAPSLPKLAGRFLDPFDPLEVEEELGARLAVRLTLGRGDGTLDVEVPPGPLRIAVLPPMSGAVAEAWSKARGAIEGKRFAEVVPALEAAADAAAREEAPSLAAWLMYRGGKDLANARRYAEARTALAKAAERAGSLGRPLVLSRIRQAEYWSALAERRYPAAREAAEEMAKAEASGGTGRIAAFAASQAVATSLFYQGDLARAEALFLEVIAAYEKAAPGTYLLASALADLDILYQRKPDYDRGAVLAERALAIVEPSFPRAAEVPKLHGHLGIFATLRGDPEVAEREFAKAIAAHEAIDPGSIGTAMALNNLAVLVGNQGDLEREEALLRRSLAIREKLGVPPAVLATIYTNLGGIATKRQDHAAAREMYAKSLALYEKQAPESLNIVGTLYNLAIEDRALGRTDEAAAELDRALAVAAKAGPDARETTMALKSLGGMQLEAKRYDEARASFEKALAIDRKAAAGSHDTADSLWWLGNVAWKSGDLSRAEQLHREALAIHARIEPGTKNHALSLHALGSVLRAQGRTEEALASYRQAVDALEAQRGRLGGGSESDARYAATTTEIYADTLDLLLSLGRADDAFLLLERSRARSLLSMLAERDLVFSADVPAEVEQEGRRLDAEYDRAQGKLARLEPGKDDEAIDAALATLRDLRARQEARERDLRARSPRLSALRSPRPLGVREVQATLDPGTVLLSYGFVPSGLVVFVARGGDAPAFSWKVLPLTHDEAAKKVKAFRNLLVRPGAGRSEVPAPLLRAAVELHGALLAPFDAELADAVRVLVVPDGPLRLLPFSALAREDAAGGPPAFLASWKPFHKAVSATVYAELKRGRKALKPGAGSLAAFGDPWYPQSAPGEPEVRRAGAHGVPITPLPSTREEVQSVAALFGPKEARTYLGRKATEEAVKALPRDTAYVHLACHGVLDEALPLDSGLVLASPEPGGKEGENGILQAWEVFQRVRLDAELVVLSACETGLGMEGGGEGLIGLTRAFQYAGARTVLASLWGVSDESTAALMKVFYRELRRGQPKDLALQAAQKALAGRHPFFWAAFELEGDWR